MYSIENALCAMFVITLSIKIFCFNFRNVSGVSYYRDNISFLFFLTHLSLFGLYNLFYRMTIFRSIALITNYGNSVNRSQNLNALLWLNDCLCSFSENSGFTKFYMVHSLKSFIFGLVKSELNIFFYTSICNCSKRFSKLIFSL